LNGEVRSIHAGVDFRAAAGTPVRAPAGGRVALAADHYFAGTLVIIDHGLGLFSFLAHLSSLSVTEGQEVGRGEVIGLSGATGRVTGPHLHWSVRLPGARVDPLSVMALFEVEPAAEDVVR
jgi:murein DD-endopeptidase MepM/ murein hydrolase activator NlpD